MIVEIPILAVAAAGVWDILWDILVLLVTALLLGTVAERFGQSVIVGYLIAGTLVGPNLLGWISTQAELFSIAELGVALLLFSIGLEFSPRRLLALGNIALKIGPLQIILTTGLGFGAAIFCGLSPSESLIVGMIVAMSSTACVMRLLKDRAEIDSQHGRTALGILLVQDVAVVPMIFLVSFMSMGGGWRLILGELVVTLLFAIVLICVFYLLFNVVVPRLLLLPTWRRNRDLPVLLAVIMATGSAWAAHSVRLSPALGAFAAGILLAVSPFATQIRADSRPLTSIMVALFFAAIGMFGDPAWLLMNWWVVVILVTVIVVGKPLIIAPLAFAFSQPWRCAIAAGVCLAQVGEFSFVLATIAHSDAVGSALIDSTTFRAMVSATLVTLLVTPYLVAAAPWAGASAERLITRCQTSKRRTVTLGTEPDTSAPLRAVSTDAQVREPGPSGLILIIGFGPAGQRVAEGLLDIYQKEMVAIDLNPDNIAIARRYGLQSCLGDATQRDTLEHAGIYNARVVVLTTPDHAATRDVIHLVRDLSRSAYIVARCRYHILHWELLHAGAHQVVDEEDQVGRRLASQIRQLTERTGESAP